ncbi:hypothetical protein NW754_013652 [Fusarium falciforme]|nr:hypothetical protein NW754_013652 [Fusarium falciforme]
MDMTLSDVQRESWEWNLPRYFKSLRETFGPGVQQESSFKAIRTEGDGVDLFLGDIGHAAPVVEVIQKLMQLAIGKSSSTMSQDMKTEQKSIDPPSDPNAIYSFVPFNNSKKQIRMIELVPAQPEDLITLRLFVANDASQHSYEALSYVWGPRDSDVGIQVNGNDFHVSGNLAEALRCLRPNQGEDSRILWVDAVCINQADNAEKSDQVALMGDIYRKAKEVLIFLGEERDGSALVMQYLKQEDTEQPELNTPPADVDGRRLKREKDVLARIERFQLDQVQLLRAADAFFRRPWWARTWVVQEYILATRPPRWYCGREWVSTANVRARLFELHVCLSLRTQPLYGDHDLLMDANIDIGKQWGSMMPHRRHNIRQLLEHERENWQSQLPFFLLIWLMYRESTDPRDRLYALCEMLDPVSKEIFVPDYNARVEHVFIKLSSYVLVSGGMRQKIYARFELLQAPGVPSWEQGAMDQGSELSGSLQ